MTAPILPKMPPPQHPQPALFSPISVLHQMPDHRPESNHLIRISTWEHNRKAERQGGKSRENSGHWQRVAGQKSFLPLRFPMLWVEINLLSSVKIPGGCRVGNHPASWPCHPPLDKEPSDQHGSIQRAHQREEPLAEGFPAARNSSHPAVGE